MQQGHISYCPSRARPTSGPAFWGEGRWQAQPGENLFYYLSHHPCGRLLCRKLFPGQGLSFLICKVGIRALPTTPKGVLDSSHLEAQGRDCHRISHTRVCALPHTHTHAYAPTHVYAHTRTHPVCVTLCSEARVLPPGDPQQPFHSGASAEPATAVLGVQSLWSRTPGT